MLFLKSIFFPLKVDFCIPKNVDGFMTEAPTENFGIVTKDDELIIPSFDRTLRGITVYFSRLFQFLFLLS